MLRRTLSKMLVLVAILPVAASCRASGLAEAADADFYVCDGCDAVGERDPASLDWNVDLASHLEPGERLVLSGVVYQSDGQTPASDVVIYAHQTNAEGRYANGSSESVWSRRHGKLRNWVRTGPDGRYEFRTIKPGVYPSRNDPAHIHLFLAEPGQPPYWIDDVVFAGEFGVDDKYRQSRENRGGLGIVELERNGAGKWVARRDIILEVHPE